MRTGLCALRFLTQVSVFPKNNRSIFSLNSFELQTLQKLWPTDQDLVCISSKASSISIMEKYLSRARRGVERASFSRYRLSKLLRRVPLGLDGSDYPQF